MDIRITYAIGSQLNHDCDKIHIDSYEMQEVVLPTDRQGIRPFTLRPQLQSSAAITPTCNVEQVQFLRIAPDERSVEG